MSTQTENTTQTTLSTLRPSQDRVENLPSISVGFGSLQGFELMQRAAKMLASSTLVPKEYQGNISNCAIALNIAARVGADPLMVMQNLVIVHGRPTWSSQFLIATVNTCGRFSALRFEFFGKPGTDEWGCRAWTIEKETGEKLVGTDVTIAIAKAEGWYARNGSKWKTIPQQMLMYRAGSWWTRAYAPELSMGLHTKEEMHDVWDAEKQEDGSYAVNLEELRNVNVVEGVAQPAHDPATGEVLEQGQSAGAADSTTRYLHPKTIITVPFSGDITKTDWDGWVERWAEYVNSMSSTQSLEKLKSLNEDVLIALARENPPKHSWALEALAVRMVAVGAMKEAA